METKVVAFSEINLAPVHIPPIEMPDHSCRPYHPESDTGVLTRESALLLIRIHPPILWTRKNYCILGRRILQLASPHLYSKDQIVSSYLPSASEDQVAWLMSAEPLLSLMAFATPGGGQDIFKISRLIDKDVVSSVAPLLTGSIETIAKLFSDCSPSTLYKLNTKIDGQNAT